MSDLTIVGGRVGTDCIHPATFTEHDQNDISSVAVEDASYILHSLELVCVPFCLVFFVNLSMNVF